VATCGWISTQLRNDLADRVKKLIKNEVDASITNLTQFVDLAVREKVVELEASQK